MQAYRENKEKKYWGLYTNFTPGLVVTDVDLIKNMLVKDADSFVDRTFFEMTEKDKIFNEFLSIMPGERWKALRSMTSPVFSSGKIKGSYPLLKENVDHFIKNCDKRMNEDGFVEISSLLGCYTLEAITNCAFGIDVNCYDDSSLELRKACYDFMNPTFTDALKLVVYFFSRRLYLALGFSFTSPATIYLEKAVQETIKARQKSEFKRGDILDYLLETLKAYEDGTEKRENKYRKLFF